MIRPMPRAYSAATVVSSCAVKKVSSSDQLFISTTNLDYNLNHNAFDRILNASSDSGDLPAISIIKNRAHFPLCISSLLVLCHTQTSHALES